MLLKTILITSIMSWFGLINGATISDVEKTDPAYKSISRTIDSGYLSLLQGNTFQGQRTITRRELAVILDQLILEIDQAGVSLSKSKLNELSNLSKTFKGKLQNNTVEQEKLTELLTGIKQEQTTLHYDLSRLTQKVKNNSLQNELDMVKDELETQKMYTWVAIGLGILGILL